VVTCNRTFLGRTRDNVHSRDSELSPRAVYISGIVIILKPPNHDVFNCPGIRPWQQETSFPKLSFYRMATKRTSQLCLGGPTELGLKKAQ